VLEGLRVLDLSRIVAGPYCAMLLGDLGADVVKLERPPRGDDLRWLHGGRGMGAIFAAVNRNKRAAAIDLRHPEGRRAGVELARRADVVIENFVPGGAEALGLGYADVRAQNPRVVYASISGFGRTGPYARRPGYNSIALGMSGIMAITGQPGDPPTRPGGSVADLAAAFLAFGAIASALVRRFRTGEGAHVDVDLLSSMLGMLPDPVARYFETGRAPGRVGNRNPYLTPAEAFRTADGFLNVVLTGPEQWDRFCEGLGDPDLAAHPRFATNADRLAHHAEFRERVEARLATAPTAEWVKRFEAVSVAAGPVYEFAEVFDDPQVRHLGLLAELEQPGLGRVRTLGFPFRVDGAAMPVRRPAPRLGEHTAEVLGELGLDADAVARLAAAGAVALAPPA
jgi:crotonobetainyl-CoA:carnitine CoA-transferase CaiB-like acyl-CoA transferase